MSICFKLLYNSGKSGIFYYSQVRKWVKNTVFYGESCTIPNVDNSNMFFYKGDNVMVFAVTSPGLPGRKYLGLGAMAQEQAHEDMGVAVNA